MIVRAVDQQPAAECFLHERRAFDRKIDADDQSFAADFADEIEALRQLFEPRAKFRASRANIREQIFFFDDRQKFQRRRANERSAAKRRPVHSRRQTRRRISRGNECAERKPAGQAVWRR